MAKESAYYTVHLITKVYGPFRLKPDAVKVAMNHATDTRRPKVYTADGRYVGQVIRFKKQTKRKGYSDYAYQFMNADGTIGNIIPTTGVVQIIDKQWLEERNDSDKYSVIQQYPYPHKTIAQTNTANKARYLAIQYLSQTKNVEKVYVTKWGRIIGEVFDARPSNTRYWYTPHDPSYREDISACDANVLKRYGSNICIINPNNGEIIGKLRN